MTVKGLSKEVKVSALDVTLDLWKGIFNSIKGDFTGCYHKITGDGDGTLGDCAWAATWLPLGKVAGAIRSMDAALRSGEGVADALKALKTLDVDAETLADIERQVDVYEEARTACKVNSFPGTTEVVLADGSRKALRDVRTGDLLLATDPATGRAQGEPVTRTFHHTTVDLVDVVLTDGGRLTSTPGHRFYVTGRVWTLASDLRHGDTLRGPDGTLRTVAALHDRHQATPRTVYDLTVSGLHTFYAVAGSNTPVLVHNCGNLALDESQFPDAHTLEEPVKPNEEEGKALSAAKTRKYGRPASNSVWVDEATAQKVLDFALDKNASRISRWMLTQGGSSELTFRGTFGPDGSSLGKVYWEDRAASMQRRPPTRPCSTTPPPAATARLTPPAALSATSCGAWRGGPTCDLRTLRRTDQAGRELQQAGGRDGLRRCTRRLPPQLVPAGCRGPAPEASGPLKTPGASATDQAHREGRPPRRAVPRLPCTITRPAATSAWRCAARCGRPDDDVRGAPPRPQSALPRSAGATARRASTGRPSATSRMCRACAAPHRSTRSQAANCMPYVIRGWSASTWGRRSPLHLGDR
ncbi:polymorphic toxin-type HINT domain-containing protein [Streptomyces sp. NPDC002573]|uniref:polymorphic toxin-type HINT domain-containing protein n=1 Tax=Streptomyces sp. NPDC002573 TaxID=3364651 RepID=UPI003694F013